MRFIFYAIYFSPTTVSSARSIKLPFDFHRDRNFTDSEVSVLGRSHLEREESQTTARERLYGPHTGCRLHTRIVESKVLR